MAPNFLSKLVKARDHHDRTSSSHSRGSSSFGSTASSAANVNEARQRVLSTPAPPSINIHHLPSEFGQRRSHDVENSSTKSSLLSGSQPSVTVIPPSPQSHVSSFPSSSREGSLNDRDRPGSSSSKADDKRRPQPVTVANGGSEDALPTPTPNTVNRSDTGAQRPLTPSSSTGNLRSRFRARSRSFTKSRDSSPTDPRRASTTMVRKDAERPPLPPPPLPPVLTSPPSSASAASRARSATSPSPSQSRQVSETGVNGQPLNSPTSTSTTSTISGLPVVESPTHVPAEYLDSPSLSSPQLTPTPHPPNTGINPALLSPTGQGRDADAASIISTASTRKRRLWQRKDKDKDSPPGPASPKRRPTALASALAASGIAMANPGAAVPQFEGIPSPTTPPSPPARHPARSGSLVGSAYRRSHTPRSSVDVGRSRNGSLTVPDASGDGESVYLSGSAGEDEDDDDDSDDEALLDDLNADDIPVTGFAVASNKRNADFHELFQSIPEGDYLIEDYGCALQREILIQGRIYISENHICFHANIFGWITDLIIPIYEILALEKKMTAFVIPNALQITTRNAKYTFASFLARDTVYDVIYNIWRLARPEDADDIYDEGDGDGENMPGSLPVVAGANGAVAVPVKKATQCQCGKDGGHYSDTAMEAVFPGTPERIYNLMFASGFIKDFMRIDQKLDDIQISDWTPSPTDPKCLTRNMSYIKPLGGSIGPRQTKCEIRDETIHCDFDDYVTTITTTRTPDVPSGGVFAVKTRTCIMWASAMSTRVIVTTQVEWTGRSFIKGIIEKSAIDGQKTYHNELDKGMREYIKAHQSEFVPAGVDLAVVEEAQSPAAAPSPTTGEAKPMSEEEARKSREKERNARGLQWAYDTFDGAYAVARRSTTGALELVRDAWDQSSSATILYFVITFLVLSNVWTLMLVGRREEAGRRKELRRMEEREKWVQGIVTTLWDELAAGKIPQNAAGGAGGPGGVQLPAPARPDGSWRSEVAEINKVLDLVDERVQGLRTSLKELD